MLNVYMGEQIDELDTEIDLSGGDEASEHENGG
jgi:hypothetical protein